MNIKTFGIKSRLKAWMLGGTAIFCSILIALVVVEFATRLFDSISPPMPRSWKEISLSSPPPPPYRNADFDVKQLTFERNNVNWKADDKYGYQASDTKGSYINIVDGIRVTTGSPSNPKNRVWVFGGSTIMCQEVPDRYTVPSQIQKILNEKYPETYQVINLGATSLTTKHQFWRLFNSTKELKKGDIVIFYDGDNDIIQSLYYKNPTGTMFNANRQQIEAGGIQTKVVFYLYGKFGEYSAFVRRFLYPFNPEMRMVKFPEELVEQMKQSYMNNISKASDYANKNGATFYHFLQPSLYSVNSLTEWEQSLLSNGWLYPLELKEVYAVGYLALKEVNNELQNKGISSFDISGVLNQKSQEIFLDTFHVNGVGNSMISKEIVSKIKIN